MHLDSSAVSHFIMSCLYSDLIQDVLVGNKTKEGALKIAQAALAM